MIGRLNKHLIMKYPRLMAYSQGELPYKNIADLYTKNKTENNTFNIPRNVYQTWETPFLGKTHYEELKEFINNNVEFNFYFYTQHDIDAYMEEYYGNHNIYEVYSSALFGPLKTDIWRYCILFERGGWYFDINKGVKRKLASLVDATDSELISFEGNVHRFDTIKNRNLLQQPDNLILNWGLAFSKNHIILEKTIDNIVKHYADYKGVRVPHVKDAIVAFTGPGMLTKSIHEIIENEPVTFKQAEIDFFNSGVISMNRSWVRYAQIPSYANFENQIIVK